MIDTSKPIGRTFGTEETPNTAFSFNFWADKSSKIGIGTIVKVVSDDETIYGTVTAAMGFNDLESPLHEVLSIGRTPDAVPPTERPEIRVFEAAVLRREPEEPVSAVPIGQVFLASEKDVQIALRIDKFFEDHGIAAGCYGTKDDPIPVFVDSRFLLGPEAGHLNITGTSGLAAKTSYILFLLTAIFQQYKTTETVGDQKGVAALLFNTKGTDLLYLDLPPKDGELDNLDRTIYEKCGLDAEPFSKVRYYAPFENDNFNLKTLRRNDELDKINPTMPMSFGLSEVLKHMEVLLNREDLDAKADAYIQFLNTRYVEKASPIDGDNGEVKQARTLDDLIEIVKYQLKKGEDQNKTTFMSHSTFTISKIERRLSGLSYRFSGLIGRDGKGCGPFDAPFEPNTVYVVDISGLDIESQNLVFAAFITMLHEKMEEQKLGVARLVVMLDEMNKYAPSGGSDTHVLKSLRDIASRGRYMGLTLFGAQQFRSRVDKEIVGNAATHAFGHIEAEELAQPGYSYMSRAVKEKLGALAQGEILLKHPHFGESVFLRFPRPGCLKGSDGMRRYPRSEPRSVIDLIVDVAASLGASPSEVKNELEKVSQDEKSLSPILHALRRTQKGQNWRAAFYEAPKVAVVRTAQAVVGDGADPFA